MATVLKFVQGEFVEKSEKDADATLELVEDPNGGGKATLSFPDGTGLIVRRTAQRQAESICATGFLSSNGARLGAGFQLSITGEEPLSDAHTRVGHEYNRA